MDYEPDGTQELLIDSSQERTARRTEHLLVAARLSFFFFHGLLIISASLGFEEVSWWLIFTPAWLGDVVCLVLVILSWFGSCPYVQSCLQERQARLGDTNPSILTDILPDIVMGILSLIYMLLALVAELLLCRYLSELSHGFDAVPVAPVTVIMLVSILTCCRGLCIFTNSALFCCIGLAALSTCVLLLVTEDVPGPTCVLFVPWAAAVLCLLLSAICQLRRCRCILCREELILRILELVVLTLVLASVLAAMVELSQSLALGIGDRHVGMAGIVAGTGICALALLHARMAVAESRFGAISDRLLIAEMRCGENASLPSSVASVNLEVSGDLSLSAAARSGSGWQSGRMVRVVCPPDPEAGDATSNSAAASAEAT